jgi:hypothetical protein
MVLTWAVFWIKGEVYRCEGKRGNKRKKSMATHQDQNGNMNTYPQVKELFCWSRLQDILLYSIAHDLNKVDAFSRPASKLK